MPYKTKNFDSLLKEYETFLEEAIEEVAVTAEEFFKSRFKYEINFDNPQQLIRRLLEDKQQALNLLT